MTYLLDMYLSSEVSIDVGINQQMKHMENVLNLSFFFSRAMIPSKSFVYTRVLERSEGVLSVIHKKKLSVILFSSYKPILTSFRRDNRHACYALLV